jgi:carboxypeptidase T
MNHWANLGAASWGITGATYHSASYCITDSDGRNYQNNQFSEFLFMQRLDLSQAQDASLKFWAKWEIEDNYDYVQILASDLSGNFVPLCGLYTNPGSADQAANQPLYDGNQSAWVQEHISLRDFVGNANVQLKLRLVSDGGLNMDGFYFDDLEIHTTDARIVNVNEAPEFVPIAAAYPNPAQTQVYIPLSGVAIQTSETAQLLVYNQMGQCIHTQALQPQAAGLFLDISQWARGAYFYQIRSAQSLSPAQKLIVD